jgi:hypothetical protein
MESGHNRGEVNTAKLDLQSNVGRRIYSHTRASESGEDQGDTHGKAAEISAAPEPGITNKAEGRNRQRISRRSRCRRWPSAANHLLWRMAEEERQRLNLSIWRYGNPSW